VGLSLPEALDGFGIVSSFGEDADCRIYVASQDGPVYRLTEPGAGGPVGCRQPQPPPPPPSEPPASNDFSFGKVRKNKKKGTAKLTLEVPGPGELELAKTKKVRGDDDSADEAGKEKLSIKPKGKAKKRLNHSGKTKVKAEVTFAPDGSEPNLKRKRIKLLKR
jgi:hypothetical protein